MHAWLAARLASASFKRFTAHKNPLNYSNCIAKHFCDDGDSDARPRLAEILGVAAATKCLFDFHLFFLHLFVRSFAFFLFAIFPRWLFKIKGNRRPAAASRRTQACKNTHTHTNTQRERERGVVHTYTHSLMCMSLHFYRGSRIEKLLEMLARLASCLRLLSLCSTCACACAWVCTYVCMCVWYYWQHSGRGWTHTRHACSHNM